MRLPFSMADFVLCDSSLQKAFSIYMLHETDMKQFLVNFTVFFNLVVLFFHIFSHHSYYFNYR